MTVKEDFYLDQRGLASYFEKEWFDKYLEQSKVTDFEFAGFNSEKLYSSFNEKIARAVIALIREKKLHPKKYLEIGPGLGRTFYEIAKETTSLKEAILIEPSENLSKSLEKIFLNRTRSPFLILKGNGDFSEVEFDSSQITSDCSHISKTILQKTFEEAQPDLPSTNLLVCLNVLDQCKNPIELLDLIKSKTVQGGILVTSCTFQWQKKYLGSDYVPFNDLGAQFDEGWEILAEMNEPFHVRLSERCWYTFLPQVLILQKKGHEQ